MGRWASFLSVIAALALSANDTEGQNAEPLTAVPVPQHLEQHGPQTLPTNPFLQPNSLPHNWAHVRGDQFSGRSPEANLADAWPDDGPPVLWVRELGQGYSSIVVHDDRAYTQYQTSSGQYLACLQASTGESLWEYRYDWPFESNGLYPGPEVRQRYLAGASISRHPAVTLAVLIVTETCSGGSH